MYFKKFNHPLMNWSLKNFAHFSPKKNLRGVLSCKKWFPFTKELFFYPRFIHFRIYNNRTCSIRREHKCIMNNFLDYSKSILILYISIKFKSKIVELFFIRIFTPESLSYLYRKTLIKCVNSLFRYVLYKIGETFYSNA